MQTLKLFIFMLLIYSFKLSYCLNNENINAYFIEKNIQFKHHLLKDGYDYIDDENIISNNKDCVSCHVGIINYEVANNIEIGLAPYGPVFKAIF
ncbi:hypothetical protein [Francisella salimarina]|uniref:hypothetical protein n=1 Tax=Francisella salimarina TaxID=2599927 RepID=UPI003D814D40